MELWDIYDINRVNTGKTMVRDQPYPENAYHLVIHVCVFNKNGQMLIQKRQPFKKGFPGLWDVTVGGSSVSGEDSRAAAHRELYEEVGVDHDFSGEAPFITVHDTHVFDDFYLVYQEVDEKTLKLQYEEVEAVAWATKEEIKKLISEGKFIPYYKEFIDLLFNMKDSRNAWDKK